MRSSRDRLRLSGGLCSRRSENGRRGALSDAGKVRGREVADYIHHTIGSLQTPEVDVNEHRDVIFAERPDTATQPVSVRLEPHAGGEEVVVSDHARAEVARQTADAAIVEFALEPGLYKAVVTGTDRALLFEVPSDDQPTL